METKPPINREVILKAVQRMLENNLVEGAQSLLNQNGIKATIKNGRVIEDSDCTEKYLESFITIHPKMKALKEAIRKLSNVDDEVLIVGETGTGKEILAQALHGKREGKFQTCNAGGLPEQLVESELFGHVRGAFTGAMSDKIGLITKAKNGTFFLDEVGDLPLHAQTKLLRTIQEKELRKVGGTEDETISCRFVFATNKDIEDMCKKGTFRLDLYARLSTFELHTMPLKDRVEDILYILESLNGGKEFIKAYLDEGKLSASSLKDMCPFNVRSLQQFVRQYMVLGILP